jgi:hypothetical protein
LFATTVVSHFDGRDVGNVNQHWVSPETQAAIVNAINQIGWVEVAFAADGVSFDFTALDNLSEGGPVTVGQLEAALRDLNAAIEDFRNNRHLGTQQLTLPALTLPAGDRLVNLVADLQGDGPGQLGGRLGLIEIADELDDFTDSGSPTLTAIESRVVGNDRAMTITGRNNAWDALDIELPAGVPGATNRYYLVVRGAVPIGAELQVVVPLHGTVGGEWEVVLSNPTNTVVGANGLHTIRILLEEYEWDAIARPDSHGTFRVRTPVAGQDITIYDLYLIDLADAPLIQISPSGTHTFPDIILDADGNYEENPTVLTVTVTNAGNLPSEALTAELLGLGASAFELTGENVGVIAPDASATFTIVPVDGLDEGTHIALVRIAGRELWVEVTVTPYIPFTPLAPLPVPTGRVPVYHLRNAALLQSLWAADPENADETFTGFNEVEAIPGLIPAGTDDGGVFTVLAENTVRVRTATSNWTGGWQGLDVAPHQFSGLQPGDTVEVLVVLEEILTHEGQTAPGNQGLRIEQATGMETIVPVGPQRVSPAVVGTPVTLRAENITAEWIEQNSHIWTWNDVAGARQHTGNVAGIEADDPPRFRIAGHFVNGGGFGGSQIVIHDILIHRAAPADLNFVALDAAILQAQGRGPATDYTTDSWTNLQTVLGEAVALRATPGDATQGDIDAKVTALTTAINNLVALRAVTFSVTSGVGTLTAAAGTDAVTTGDRLAQGTSVEFTATPTHADYRVGTWTITGGDAIVGTPSSVIRVVGAADLNVTVQFVTVGGLRNILRDLIAQAEGRGPEENYTDGSWADLQDELDSARAVYADTDATADEIQDAIDDLTDAINGLTPRPCDDCGEFPCVCPGVCDDCDEFPCVCPPIGGDVFVSVGTMAHFLMGSAPTATLNNISLAMAGNVSLFQVGGGFVPNATANANPGIFGTAGVGGTIQPVRERFGTMLYRRTSPGNYESVGTMAHFLMGSAPTATLNNISLAMAGNVSLFQVGGGFVPNATANANPGIFGTGGAGGTIQPVRERFGTELFIRQTP